MKSKFSFIFTIIFTLTMNSFVSAQSPNWYQKLQQIKMMKTSRQTLEKLFNNPKVVDSYKSAVGLSIDYQIKEGQLSVVYSNGKCSPKSEYGYDVDKDIITNLEFELKKQIDIKKLKLNLNSFDRAEIEDIIGVFTYRNEDLGEYYITGEYFKNGIIKVGEIQYFPTTEQKRLACKDRKN